MSVLNAVLFAALLFGLLTLVCAGLYHVNIWRRPILGAVAFIALTGFAVAAMS